MFRYYALAAVLRFFSATRRTRRLYRWLGNRIAPKIRLSRSDLVSSYLDRAELIWSTMDEHPFAEPGARILELGTGWLHWESTLIRLRRDVCATLYDVWDNRQLPALQGYFAKLSPAIEARGALSPRELARAHEIIAKLLACGSFDALYGVLEAEYVVEPSGTLQRFSDESFDAVISYNVLEHVHRETLPVYVRDMARVLRPGGYSIQKIDVGDHLAYYFPGTNKKAYLRFSDRKWHRWCENEVQYFNRVQRSEWMRLFADAGLELVVQEFDTTNIQGLPIADQYADLEPEDLACVGFRVIHRKPT
jgi:SAM-dependent methyltransferase